MKHCDFETVFNTLLIHTFLLKQLKESLWMELQDEKWDPKMLEEQFKDETTTPDTLSKLFNSRPNKVNASIFLSSMNYRFTQLHDT
jgi:hypothetical protein